MSNFFEVSEQLTPSQREKVWKTYKYLQYRSPAQAHRYLYRTDLSEQLRVADPAFRAAFDGDEATQKSKLSNTVADILGLTKSANELGTTVGVLTGKMEPQVAPPTGTQFETSFEFQDRQKGRQVLGTQPGVAFGVVGIGLLLVAGIAYAVANKK